jgi:hypothetical protein
VLSLSKLTVGRNFLPTVSFDRLSTGFLFPIVSFVFLFDQFSC